MKAGQLAVKIAGKDSGKTVVVIGNIDDNFVMIDGPVKRKRCNITHLEPMDKFANIKKDASHSEIVKVFKELKLEVKEDGKKRTEGKEGSAGKIHGTAAHKPADTAITRAVK